MIRGGTYELPGALVFAPQDSGTANAPIVYQAFPGESPILSGGRRLTGWTEGEKGRWQTSVSDVLAETSRPTQLFVNDQRRLRPMVPGKGYFYIDASAAGTKPARQDRFRFGDGHIDPGWKSPGDVEFVAFHKWSTSRIPIASVDGDARIVTLAGATWHGQHAELSPAVWYRLENVSEALDEPGEWYLDRATRILTYLARPDEDPNRDAVVLPRLERIIEFRGDIGKGTFVEHIELCGLTFAHSAWHTPDRGHSVYQAEVNMDGAVSAQNAWHCAISASVVRHTGNYGIQLGAGCSHWRVIDCELFDLGAGGVKIGTGRFNEEPDQRKWASHCEIRDCLVAHGGRLHPAAVGLWIGHAHHNTLEHNHVRDMYYSAISVGWRWTEGDSPADHNVVAWNRLHTLGQGVMSDMGGIYTLGESPGTQLHHNLIHGVTRARYGGWGLYHDQASADIVSEYNIVHHTEDAAFHLHYGRRLLLRNNVFALGKNEQMKLSNPKKSGTLALEGNIWFWTDSDLHAGKLDDEMTFRRNLYWRTDGKPIRFPGGKTSEQWREREPEFEIADPGFAAPANGDFTLAPGAATDRIGFEPFSLAAAGRTTDSAKTAVLPAVPRTFEPAPPKPPPAIHQDFELLALGQRMPGWGLLAANRDENAAVTDETAANGKHSLKFQDGPGGAVYFPHLYRDTTYESGVFRVAFNLRVEPGAKVQFECRDNTPWFTPGPGIEVQPEGTLESAGRELLTVPHSQWFHIDLTCGIGPERTGTYRLVLTLPDGDTRTFDDLPLGDGFETMGWMGFASLTKERVVYYVDDFVLERAE